jgi:hypothetical protein
MSDDEAVQQQHSTAVTYVFARYKPGVVIRESERVAHVLTIPDHGSKSEALTALCGQQFPPGVMEQLEPWAGMPCIGCTLNMPSGTELEQ